MVLSDRLKAIREEKHLSQGDIESRTGLKRCYVSRVENGHTVPAIETLEKMARALEVPMYLLFYEGDKPPGLPMYAPRDKGGFGGSGRGRRYVERLCRSLARMKSGDLKLLMRVSEHMARRKP